jgi:hypothetical protein
MVADARAMRKPGALRQGEAGRLTDAWCMCFHIDV